MENRTDAPLTVDFTVEGPGCDERGQLELEPESDDAHIVLITCPGDTEELPEINTYTVRFTAGGYTGTYCFGLAAATPWKAVGPIWRTDPICTTEKLLAVPNYWHLMQDPGYKGDPTDIVRRFHLNFTRRTGSRTSCSRRLIPTPQRNTRRRCSPSGRTASGWRISAASGDLL